MNLTARQVAEKLGLSYVVASGLMTYLESIGQVKVVEKRFAPNGKGKPTKIYEIGNNVVIGFEDAKSETTTVETNNQETETETETEISTLSDVQKAIERLKNSQDFTS